MPYTCCCNAKRHGATIWAEKLPATNMASMEGGANAQVWKKRNRRLTLDEGMRDRKWVGTLLPKGAGAWHRPAAF